MKEEKADTPSPNGFSLFGQSTHHKFWIFTQEELNQLKKKVHSNTVHRIQTARAEELVLFFFFFFFLFFVFCFLFFCFFGSSYKCNH